MLQPTRIATVLLAATLAATSLAACSYSYLDSDTTASFNPSGKPVWARPAGQAPAVPAPQTVEGLMNSADPNGQPGAGKSNAAEMAANVDAYRSRPAAASSLFATARPVETRPVEVARLPEIAPPPEATQPPEMVRPVEPPPQAIERPRVEGRGHAYLFRGVGGLIYSLGMDRLAQEINRTGVKTNVSTYLMWRVVVSEAIQNWRRDHAPITVIGHSLGGDSAVAFADTLNSAGIPVSLLVTYDATRIAADVPSNVQRFINIFQSRNIMGGGDVTPGRDFHGHYASYNLKDHGEIIHINIEKSEQIHAQLVRKIAELAATPVAQGEAVPIRYVVPANAAIELWDSGMPVVAEPGDTLQSLAAAYRVPVWALAQLNRIPQAGNIAPGQRIVVPRNLSPGEPAAAVPVSGLGPNGR